ncbi:ABC transporter substrate-binding protein (plasmid) [Bradyrhizobium manausense]
MRLVGCLAVAANLSVFVCGATQAESLKEVTFASSDTALSIGSAPYSSLQPTLKLPEKYAGVTVKFQPTAGATAAVQAVSNGNAFYTLVALASFLPLARQDPNLVIVSFDPGNSLRVIVPPDSPVKGPLDLKGKVIGVGSFGTAAYPYGKAILKEAGLDPDKDVTFLPVGLGAPAADALKSGKIQAFAGFDSPNAVIGNLLGVKMRDVPSPLNDLVGMVGMVVTRSEIEKHPKVVAGLCRALYESFFFAEGNIEGTVRNHFKVYPGQLPSNKPLDEAVREGEVILRAKLDVVNHRGAGGIIGYQELPTVQHTVDKLYENGILPERMEISKYADQRFKNDCGGFDPAELRAQARAWKPQ